MDQPSLFGDSGVGVARDAVAFIADFAGWQAVARRCLLADQPPDAIWWQPEPVPVTGAEPSDAALAESRNQRRTGPTVPRAFVQLARIAACHRATDRWALLYAVLWRLTHGERHLLELGGDPQVARLTRYAKAVRRDVHKMKAFVRFRAVNEPQAADGAPRYIAWFEPEHPIVAYASGFFRRRFANMRWSIFTPERCVHWEGAGELWYTPGADKRDAPNGDDLEDAWRVYYRSIFNPARVKIRAMQSEMPQKYWKNMPEADLIPELLQAADRRVAAMETAEAKTADRLRCGPRPASPEAEHAAEMSTTPRDTLDHAALRARTCRRCPLWEAATQTVFGEGPANARLMIVGEQPGDAEDLAGRPFIGPAGRLLDQALAAAGIQREAVYLTNAVKHFKFTPRGKQRLHAKPDGFEVASCLPWLGQELDLVDPDLVVCLGATAAGALLGGPVKITRVRGQVVDYEGRRFLPTVHPAYILRQRDPAASRREYARFVADLQQAVAFV